MGIFREILQTVSNYYKPSNSNTQSTPRNLSNIKNYEWWNISDENPGGLNTNDYYRSIAYACINARAEKTNTAVLTLQQQLANGKLKPIIKHPFIDLMANPNTFQQSFKELIYRIAISLDLYPQGAFLYYPKNIFNMPIGLYHLPSKNVSFELTQDQTAIARYRYTFGSNFKFYLPEEIIHFKIPNPDNPFFSKHTAGAARLTLDAEQFQLLYQKNFYLNDAAIGGMFSTDTKLTDEAFKRLDAQISQKYTNPQNAGRYFLGENGLHFEKGVATPREADYGRSHIDTRNEVCGLFRTPKSILGFTDDVNRANAEAANYSFLVNTVKPFSFHIWDRLEQFIKVAYDERLFLEANYDLQESREVQLKEIDTMRRNGIMSRNEIRVKQGLEPISNDPKMDEYVGEAIQTNNQNQNNGQETEPQ